MRLRDALVSDSSRARVPDPTRPDPTGAAAALVDKQLEPEDFSRYWHRALAQPGGGNPGTMHAVHSWRAEYATCCAAINRLPPESREIAADAVCRWFWLAPDGPIQRPGIPRNVANPGHLAKYISSDLRRANEWYAQEQARSQGLTGAAS